MPGSSASNPRYLMVGDPGFFSWLGKLGKSALSLGPSLIPGGGAARTAVKGIAKVVGAATTGAVVADTVQAGSRLVLASPSVVGRATGVLARTSGIGRAAKVALPIAATAAAAGALWPGGQRSRRRRAMNALNPRALARATRRLHGFHAFAQKTEQELRRLAPQKRPCAPRRKPCR